MLNEKFTFCFKVTIRLNITKSHATRLKSAKYKTRVIKEQLLKWMSYNKMNQSHGLSYDQTLFLSYQKVSNGNIACSYSKGCELVTLMESLLISRDVPPLNKNK